ncbi:MAG TPA: glycosyltransferase [Chitinophagales bacterium]|nr:glycosyltransferase [Chitinophagales bacterium]
MQSANDSTSITAYSFVVPAFNEQDNIPVLYDRIKTLMTIHPNLNTENQTWELIFVNDGSTDNTLTVLNKPTVALNI